MRMLLRFLLFDRPDRQSTTQIQPDIVVSNPPGFAYGELVNVGPDDIPPLDWPPYVVADIPHGKQIDDPERPGRRALVFEVYLAREADWPQFKLPDYMWQQMPEDGE